jgi:hypothetical protein
VNNIKIKKHQCRREREEDKERADVQTRENAQKWNGGKSTHPNTYVLTCVSW